VSFAGSARFMLETYLGLPLTSLDMPAHAVVCYF
jgi:hypothetical protein